ncbi:MAG: hypothetical protein QMD05_05690, partial [Candidatus Brocadiaceae bacterium]|nr:hypothetical protein [Candidatus Brocadiaceae bacterium]
MKTCPEQSRRVGDFKSKIFSACLLLTVCCLLSTVAYAQTAPSLAEIKRNLDILWVIAASAMVFFMQVGFTAFQAGSVQAKNAIAIALKNLTVCLLCSVFYFFCGFG